MKRTFVQRWLTAAVLAVVGLSTQPASAFSGVGGKAAGDMGFYWFWDGEVWVFAHRLGNIDNRIVLQPVAPSGVTLFGNIFNAVPQQISPGGGLVLEVTPDLNIGMWASTYQAPLGSFVDDAVGNIAGWGDANYNDPADELEAIDPRLNGGNGLEAPRQFDFFVSKWFPEMDLETGLRLWYGGAGRSLRNDDSTGPIGLDVDSNATTANSRTLTVKDGKFGLTDLGVAAGAGWTGMEGMRFDGGLEFNMLGINWAPNGINDYVSAGGMGLGLNARAHIDLTEQWTVGGFARFSQSGASFEPKKQRDGGDLSPINTNLTPDQAGSLPNPSRANQPTAEPVAGVTELSPVRGIKYEQTLRQLQVAAIARFVPNSRINIYSALGFESIGSGDKLSVGGQWFDEQSVTITALPFINMGAEGALFSWLDVMLGATKRWQATSTSRESFDGRIPNNGEGPGPAGSTPPVGNEQLTNANRRRITTENSIDSSVTNLMVGTRIHWDGFQITGQVNPAVVSNGTWVLSGVASPVWAWVALTWDWDFDQDVQSGNGIYRHMAEAAAPAATPAPATMPAPTPAPAPTPPPAEPYTNPYDTAPTTPPAPSGTDTGSSPYGTPQTP